MHQNIACNVCPYVKGLCNLCFIRKCKFFERTESFHKNFIAFFSDVRKFKERRYCIFFCSELLVAACCKAVCFVAYTLQKPECITSFGKTDRFAFSGPVNFFITFCKTRYRYFKSERRNYSVYGIYLAYTAVY